MWTRARCCGDRKRLGPQLRRDVRELRGVNYWSALNRIRFPEVTKQRCSLRVLNFESVGEPLLVYRCRGHTSTFAIRLA